MMFDKGTPIPQAKDETFARPFPTFVIASFPQFKLKRKHRFLVLNTLNGQAIGFAQAHQQIVA
jgi:hypothetical protein